MRRTAAGWWQLYTVSHGPHSVSLTVSIRHPSRTRGMVTMVIQWWDSTGAVAGTQRQFLFGGYAKPRIPGVAARSTGLSAVAPVPISPALLTACGLELLVHVTGNTVSYVLRPHGWKLNRIPPRPLKWVLRGGLCGSTHDGSSNCP